MPPLSFPRVSLPQPAGRCTRGRPRLAALLAALAVGLPAAQLAQARTDGPSLVPLTLQVRACLVGVPRCEEGRIESGGDLNQWLQSRLPGGDALSVTLTIAPGRYELPAGWRLDADQLTNRLVALSIVGAGAQRTVLRGSIALQSLPHELQRDARGVTTIRLRSERSLTAEPWNLAREQPSHALLFDDGGSWSLARWPRTGWASIAEVRDSPGAARFTLDAQWSAARRHDPNAWAWGFFRWNWYDEHLRLQPGDADPAWYGLRGSPKYGVAKGGRVRVLNARVDVTQVRDYAIDAQSGALHLMLPRGLALAQLRVARLAVPLLALHGLHNVDVRDIGFAETRGDAIVATQVSELRLHELALVGIGARAIVVTRSDHVSVVDVDVRDCGQGGVSLEGGERRSLLSANNRISGSRIAQVGSIIETAGAAIRLSGVGASAIGNDIRDVPHNAVFFEGNEHLIADNNIVNACADTDDAGAIYAGADWSYRGNVVRGNAIAGRRGRSNTENIVGVYLDDMLSGTIVEGNLLLDLQRGVLVGGGRDNIVRNNLFVGTQAPVHVDARALGWAAASVAPGGDLAHKLLAVPHAQARWRTAYPAMQALLQPGAAGPAGNIVEDNYRSGPGADEFAAEALSVSHLVGTAALPGPGPVAGQRLDAPLAALLARCRRLAACGERLP